MVDQELEVTLTPEERHRRGVIALLAESVVDLNTLKYIEEACIDIGRATASADAEARSFFLEHELVQAHHTIGFLRDCVAGTAHHAYPEQTERRLRNIEAFVELPEGCVHSHHGHDDCASCVASRQQWEDARRHATTLGWAIEAGRWPRPHRAALADPPRRWSDG